MLKVLCKLSEILIFADLANVGFKFDLFRQFCSRLNNSHLPTQSKQQLAFIIVRKYLSLEMLKVSYKSSDILIFASFVNVGPKFDGLSQLNFLFQQFACSRQKQATITNFHCVLQSVSINLKILKAS